MPGQPGDQIPLVLLGKFHHKAVFVDALPELFHPLVRLPGAGRIDKHHHAILRNVRQHRSDPVPVCLVHLEQVDVLHLHKSSLRHHGQVLHRLGKGRQIEGLRIEAMVIEGFRQRIQHQLF